MYAGAGRLLAEVHEELGRIIRPGISTKEIDRMCEKLIRERGCIPNFLHYQGYPASVCVSVNEEVVHGIPRTTHIIQEGDIVSLDTGLIYKGYHSDAARTHAVGRISPAAQRLLDVTKQSFFEGIRMARGRKQAVRYIQCDRRLCDALRIRYCKGSCGTRDRHQAA